MLGNLIVIMLVMLVPVCFRFPFIGLLLYCWFDLAAPHIVFWNTLEFLPLAQIIGLASFGGLAVFWKGPKRINIFTTIILLYVIWFTFTYFQALVPQAAAFKWDRSLKIFLPLALMSMMLTSRARIELVLWMYVGVIAASTIRGAALTLLTGGGGLVVIGPFGSFIEDRNVFATVMVSTIPLTVYLASASLHLARQPLVRFALLSFPVVTLIAIVGTFSRGGLLALGLVGVVAVAFTRYRIVAGALILAATIAMVQFAPESWRERMETTQTYQQDKSALGRLQSWHFAIDMVKARPIGGGFGVFHLNKWDESPDGYLDSHSWFFEVLGEQGIPGIVLVAGLFLLCLWRMSILIWRTRAIESLRWANALARALLMSLVGLLAGGFFVGIASYSFTYLVPMCAIGLSVLVADEIRRAGSGRAAALPGSQRGARVARAVPGRRLGRRQRV